MMLHSHIQYAAIILTLLLASALSAAVRIGDAGSTADPARFDDNFPDMKEWATAGVQGGIPDRAAVRLFKTLKPGDDLQAVIDDAAKAGGGVVLLSPGVYICDKAIDLRSNVLLRGQQKDACILECTILSDKSGRSAAAIRLTRTRHAGLEDLVIRHQAVAKIPEKAWAEKTAGDKDNAGGVSNLHVAAVVLDGAEDCWIDNCSIVQSGSHPYVGTGSHITVRDTLIDGAFNKGDGSDPAGSGIVNFTSSYGLMYNCTVRNVRHALCLRGALSGEPCKFNVILDCNFVGDINFHGNRTDQGHNLLEGNLVHSPPTHGWCAWSYWRPTDVGPETIAFKCIGWGGPGQDKFASTDPDKVYTFTGMHDSNILGVVDKPAPRPGTLYAVTGNRPTRPEAYGPWPKTPADAQHLLEQRMARRTEPQS